MTKQLTDENNLKQIRKIEILKKRKRRLEKALIRKYKEQKLANSKLEKQRLKSQNSLNFNARTGVACRKTANIIKNETMITRIEKRLQFKRIEIKGCTDSLVRNLSLWRVCMCCKVFSEVGMKHRCG